MMAEKKLIDMDSLETTTCGDNQLKRQIVLGDILWIKIRDSSWWPSQVVDEKNMCNKPNKKPKDEVLVRLYGSYDYLYVDPVKSCSEFANIFKQEKNSIKEAFQKALEEDLSRIKSAGKSKRKASESKENAAAKSPQGKKQKGDKILVNLEADDPTSPGPSSGKPKQASGNHKSIEASKAKRAKQGGAEKPNGAEKAMNGASKIKKMKQDGSTQMKLKVVEEDPNTEIPSSAKCDAPEATADLSVRRVRVMQSLGLIAPLGSPFRKNGLF